MPGDKTVCIYLISGLDVMFRCRTCQNRLPAWYVLATMGVLVAIYAAFIVVEKVF